MWILPYSEHQILRRLGEFTGDLRSAIVNSNSIPVMSHPAVKCRVNLEFSGHPQWLSCFS